MNTHPHPKRPTVNPAVTVTIRCRDYEGHRFLHRLEGHVWRCPVCDPGPVNQPAPTEKGEAK